MRRVRHLGGFWTNPCHRHCISMVQALLDCGCRVTELTRAVGLARLLCSLVNPLGHMGLVAHLRKETELCVRVVDLYLFVCVSFAWHISQPPGFARDMLRHPRCNSEGISGGHVESNSGRTKSPCGHRCTCTHMPMHLLFQIY